MTLMERYGLKGLSLAEKHMLCDELELELLAIDTDENLEAFLDQRLKDIETDPRPAIPLADYLEVLRSKSLK
jgi:hypothetical protein